jgi:hypothetical protein
MVQLALVRHCKLPEESKYIFVPAWAVRGLRRIQLVPLETKVKYSFCAVVPQSAAWTAISAPLEPIFLTVRAPAPSTFNVGVVVVLARFGCTLTICPVAFVTPPVLEVTVITFTEPAPGPKGIPPPLLGVTNEQAETLLEGVPHSRACVPLGAVVGSCKRYFVNVALFGPSHPARLEPSVGVPVLPGKVISPGFAPPVVVRDRADRVSVVETAVPLSQTLDEDVEVVAEAARGRQPVVWPESPPPPPLGVAHVPSPRQKVELEALVPLFRFVTGRFPVMVAPAPRLTVCEVSLPPSAPPRDRHPITVVEAALQAIVTV